MRNNYAAVIVLTLSLVCGALMVAGCGSDGGSPESAASKSSSAGAGGGQTASSSESDCRELGHLTNDLALIDGFGFEYAHARAFIDDYQDRAPDEISDSVQRLRDIVDRYADAAEKAGVNSGDLPLPDQAEEVKGALDFSDDDQAANGKAVQTVDTWVTNGCGS